MIVQQNTRSMMGTNLKKLWVGALHSVYHERAPMSCLQQLDALVVNNLTNNNIQWSHQQL